MSELEHAGKRYRNGQRERVVPPEVRLSSCNGALAR
jgi:hypothetical protein